MLTVLEAVNLSAGYLQKKGIDSAKLNAEILLAHLLKCRRLDLYLSFDRPLTKDETDSYREMLKRRAGNEPLQYITGEVEFYGLPFKVNNAALIPRQETEILVETVIQSFSENEATKILDIGTGSGIIAISIAKNLAGTSVSAIDISESALTLAKENAELNNVADRVEFIKKDIIMNSDFNVKYDAVVSNPPYVSLSEYGNLEPELRVYEPKAALTDNSDGFGFYRSICSSAKNYLKSKGKIFFELGQGQHGEVERILISNNFINIRIIKDYPGIERVITGELNC